MNLHTLSYVQIPINSLYTPTAIDYEATEGRIYFVDPRLQQIVSVHFSGTDIRELKQLDSSKFSPPLNLLKISMLKCFRELSFSNLSV